MLDELRDLFLRALKFDSKDKFDRIPLIREWNEAVDHVQEVFNHMTDKDQNLVPVVRCGECVHWERYDNTAGCGYCHKVKFEYANGYVFNPVREPDFYCADGERKDGGQDE